MSVGILTRNMGDADEITVVNHVVYHLQFHDEQGDPQQPPNNYRGWRDDEGLWHVSEDGAPGPSLYYYHDDELIVLGEVAAL